jgi:hypothetical protein
MGCGSDSEPVVRRPQTSRIAIVTDRSNSIEHGDGAACSAVATLARAALAEESPFAKGDQLGGLGNNLDRNEPTSIELWATAGKAMPGTPLRLAEGRLDRQFGVEDYDATVLQRRKRAAEVAQEFKAACLQEASVQTVSPVYSALTAAVASLKNGCAQKSECLLIVQSDLVETFEPGLKSSVQTLLKGGQGEVEPLPEPIDLEDRITVFLCGYSGSTDALSETARRSVVGFWRDKVLLRPKKWVEQPICPGYSPSS